MSLQRRGLAAPGSYDAGAPPGCDGNSAGYCVPGGGSVKTDCMTEWWVPGTPFIGSGRNIEVFCIPGAYCDADGDGTDGTCTFRVALCLNTSDPALQCTSPGVLRFELKKPNALYAKTPADTINAGNVLGVLAGPPLRGVSGPTASAISFAPPIQAGDVCTSAFDVVVPLKSRGGTHQKGSVKLRSVAVAPQVGLTMRGVKDSDLLRLSCYPR